MPRKSRRSSKAYRLRAGLSRSKSARSKSSRSKSSRSKSSRSKASRPKSAYPLRYLGILGSFSDNGKEANARKEVEAGLKMIWKKQVEPQKRLRSLIGYLEAREWNLVDYAGAGVGSPNEYHTVLYDLVKLLNTSDFRDAVQKENEALTNFNLARMKASGEQKEKLENDNKDLLVYFERTIRGYKGLSLAGTYLRDLSTIFPDPKKGPGIFSAAEFAF